MQTINGITTDLGLTAKSMPLVFTIVNRFLKPIDIKDKNGNAPQLQTTITTKANGNFSVSLWENDAGERFSFYLITTPSDETFVRYIYIPFSPSTSLHIQCLHQIGGCGDLITTIGENERLYAYSDEFLNNIDKYMMDESIFLTRTRQRTYQNFCDYADQADETKQCDAMKILDETLGAIIDQYGVTP